MRITWKEILNSEDDDVADRHIFESRKAFDLFGFIILKAIFLFAKVFFRLQVQGLEKLPRGGPYLICPNHQSYLDGILLCSIFPFSVIKQFFSLGWAPYFSGSLTRIVARLSKVVPIDHDTNLIRAMKVSANGLKARGYLGR